MFHQNRGITIAISSMLLVAVVIAAASGLYIFYTLFVRQGQSKANQENPSVTLIGPDLAITGDLVVFYVKNSGTIPFKNWSFTEGLTDSGGSLRTGGQRAVVTTLTGTPPWTFKVSARTSGDTLVEDVWVVKGA